MGQHEVKPVVSFFLLPDPHCRGENSKKIWLHQSLSLRHFMFRFRIKATQKHKSISSCSFPVLKAAWELSEVWRVHAYQRTFMTIAEKCVFFQKLKQSGFSSPIFLQLTVMCDSYPCHKIFSHQEEPREEGLSASLHSLFTVGREKWFMITIIISLLRRALLIM